MLKKLHSILFYVSDLAKTFKFYKSLGFNTTLHDETVRAELSGFKLAFIDENKAEFQKDSGKESKGIGVFVYIEVDNVDQYFNFLKQSEIKTSSKPHDWPWGKREFAVKDPDGYKLIFFNKI